MKTYYEHRTVERLRNGGKGNVGGRPQTSIPVLLQTEEAVSEYGKQLAAERLGISYHALWNRLRSLQRRRDEGAIPPRVYR